MHIGANCTDGERLLKSLLKNAEMLAGQGVQVPTPSRYRRLLRETIQELAGAAPEPGTRDVMLDAILDAGQPRRLVLSNPAFICTPARVFEAGCFYEMATFKARSLRALFPDDRLELFMAIRNPAGFVPAAWAQTKGRGFDEFLSGLDPRGILWSDVVTRLRQAVPEAGLTVWCDEDTPLIWDELIRRLAGIDGAAPVDGARDLLAAIMQPAGLARFDSYMQANPPKDQAQLRRVIAAFLDKYAIPEAVEEEIDLPGWDTALVAELTAIYEADVGRIAEMDGVRLIAA